MKATIECASKDANGTRASKAHPQPIETTIQIPIFASRYVRGLREGESPRPADYLPLHRILTKRFGTDAHFAGYSNHETPFRLTSESLTVTPVTMRLLVIDVDDPEAHGSQRTVASDLWFRAERIKLHKVCRATDAFAAMTRRGYRIIWVIPPFVIRNTADANKWKLNYFRQLCWLAREFDIVGDPRTADWQHLFRAPHATRVEEDGPEDLATIGNAREVGLAPNWPRGERGADLDTAKRLRWRSVENALRRDLVGAVLIARRQGPAGTRYATGALKQAIDNIESAADGDRNATLNSEAFSLARFFRGGELEEQTTKAALLGAAERVGLPEEEALRTLESAFAAREVK